MGLIGIIKHLSTALSSTINKAQQHQEKNYLEHRKLNSGLLGEKQVFYLCAIYTPFPHVLPMRVLSLHFICFWSLLSFIVNTDRKDWQARKFLSRGQFQDQLEPELNFIGAIKSRNQRLLSIFSFTDFFAAMLSPNGSSGSIGSIGRIGGTGSIGSTSRNGSNRNKRTLEHESWWSQTKKLQDNKNQIKKHFFCSSLLRYWMELEGKREIVVSPLSWFAETLR